MMSDAYDDLTRKVSLENRELKKAVEELTNKLEVRTSEAEYWKELWVRVASANGAYDVYRGD